MSLRRVNQTASLPTRTCIRENFANVLSEWSQSCECCEFFLNIFFYKLPLSWWRSLSYKNQSIDLQSKKADCFLYHKDLCHERVNFPESTYYYALTDRKTQRLISNYKRIWNKKPSPQKLLKLTLFSTFANFKHIIH